MRCSSWYAVVQLRDQFAATRLRPQPTPVRHARHGGPRQASARSQPEPSYRVMRQADATPA